MNKTAESVWKECIIFIEDNIKPQAFKTWFEPIKPKYLNGTSLTIQVPSKFFHEWIEEHYIKLLRVAIVRSLGQDAKLVYEVTMESKSIYNKIEFPLFGVNLKHDVFISHSSEDKDEFVRPLVNELKKNGVKVWYDEFELKLGDSLRKSIDKGLINSKSSSFFKRNWTQYELDAFVNREMNGMKVILPIWHKVSKDEVQNFSPTLADKVALNSSIHSIVEIAQEIKNLI
jgi:chromosomal replication initiation ATPase DnaA